MKKISDETARVAQRHLRLIALTKSLSVEEEDAIDNALADLASSEVRMRLGRYEGELNG